MFMTDEFKITAKFPSKCILCGNMVQEGDQVWWKKGTGIWHIIPCEKLEEVKPDNSALIIIGDDEWKDFKKYEMTYLRKINKCQKCGIELGANKDSWFNDGRRTCEAHSTA
jgi:hypothetical protein